MNSKLTLNNISKIILKNLVGIALITIICGVLGGVYAHHKRHTTYEAARYMIVGHDYTGESANEQAMADLSMTRTYAKIIESSNVAEKTYKALPSKLKKSYDSSKIQSMINAIPIDQSLVIKVSIDSDNAKDSVKLVNTATQQAAKEIKIMAPSAGTVKLFSASRVADVTSHTSPSMKKYVLLGAAVGLLIGMVVAFSITTWKHLI